MSRAGHGQRGATWRTLYLIGGVAALLAALLFRRNLAAELFLVTGRAAPAGVSDWYLLLQENPLLGVTLLDFFDLVNYGLILLLILALAAALWRVHASLVGLSVVASVLGTALSFASNQALSLLALSAQFAAASDDVRREVLLGAGEALLAMHNPGGAYQSAGAYLALFLFSIAGLLVAVVMGRSGAFGRLASWAGIVGNGFALTVPLVVILAPELAFLPHTLAAIPLIVWHFLAGRSLLRMARNGAT